MDDGCTGLICNAEAVSTTFALGTNYLITSLKGLEDLGINASSTGPNANVYKCVKEFYDEAPKGTKLYLRGAATSVTVENLVLKTNAHAWPLLEYAAGEIRTLIVKVTDANNYTPAVTHAIDAPPPVCPLSTHSPPIAWPLSSVIPRLAQRVLPLAF